MRVYFRLQNKKKSRLQRYYVGDVGSLLRLLWDPNNVFVIIIIMIITTAVKVGSVQKSMYQILGLKWEQERDNRQKREKNPVFM